jgi:endonuclease III
MIALSLREVVESLREHYGPPEPLPTADPFELILLENVAYLASPERRREAFELLKRTVGTRPGPILVARTQALEGVTARGILRGTFAAKLRECARIAVEEFGGDLLKVIRQPLPAAKRALRSFPGIGEPGAEKVLLFTGRQALLAPESNGLRVLTRLGLVRDERSYARAYAASREVAKVLGSEPRVFQEAHLLLHQHGRTLCRRARPGCGRCPLEGGCAYARRERGAAPQSRARARGARPS